MHDGAELHNVLRFVPEFSDLGDCALQMVANAEQALAAFDDHQVERAYLKQRGVNLSTKGVLNAKKSKLPRYCKSIGMGFATPEIAKTGTYVDKKCPFTSDVTIRGRILKGMVISTKMKRTVIVRRHYLHYIPKYNRFEKRHSNIPAHCSPCFPVKEGDIVTIGQCRPLSKTVSFNVVKMQSKQIFGSAKKQFALF